MNLFRRNQIPFQIWQRWRIGNVWPHVRPDHPVSLLAGISLDANVVLEATSNRFSRHLRHGARYIEFPAMIDASQPAILVATEDQRRTPMRTGLVDQPNATSGIPERHQIFAQQPDPFRLSVCDNVFR